MMKIQNPELPQLVLRKRVGVMTEDWQWKRSSLTLKVLFYSLPPPSSNDNYNYFGTLIAVRLKEGRAAHWRFDFNYILGCVCLF